MSPSRRFVIAAATLLLCLAPVAGGQEAKDRQSVLERSPTEWPRALGGRWTEWTPDAPAPEAIRAEVEAVGLSYGRGDLPGALEQIYRLFEIEPEYPPALHQAGVVYFRLRRYGDSIEAFERYVAVCPARVADTRALGHGYYTLGEYEEARAHYERVLAVSPRSAEALRGLALSHLRLGDSARALELLGRVLELVPTHANAQTWIAQILFDEERVEQADEAAARARELDPFDPRAWFLTSQILFDLGRDEEGEAARERFELLSQISQEVRALEARLLYDPRQPELLGRIVELHRRSENLAEVRRALLRWLMLAPEDVGLRIHVLDILWAMQDRRGAAEAAQALEQVGARSVEAWTRLVRYYARTRERLAQVRAEEQVAKLTALSTGDGD